MILEWQKPNWERLAPLRAQLPHALLLQGRPGLGKSALALEFAQGLLCERPQPDGTPCRTCAACGWFSQGNHPDFRLLQPESMAPEAEEGEAPARKEKKKSDQIRVEQVRGLGSFLAVGTHRGGLRVIVVDPADSMNIIAQNALLKSLEEPSAGTLFMLVSGHPQRLLPTVRSRCQVITILQPALDIASKWLIGEGSFKSKIEADAALAVAGGAPLAARQAAETAAVHAAFLDALQDPDPLAMAQQFESVEAALVIGWLQRWVLDILRFALAGSVHYHPQRQAQIARRAERADPRRLGRYQQDLLRARALASHPLNAKLFLEELIIGYRSAAA